MNDLKKYNPLIILWDIWHFIKNTFFFFVYFFIIKHDSVSPLVKYGRIACLVIFGLTMISLILKWFTTKYQLDDVSFHIYKGIFNKSERTIPFSKIQNVQRRTSFFHRIFGITSITFETGLTGADAAVEFEVLSKQEADTLEAALTKPVENEEIEAKEDLASDKQIQKALPRRIHFAPTRKDMLKASFTSLSFIVLIPLLLSLYFKLTEIFKLEEKAEGLIVSLMGTWWVIALIGLILILASISFGIVSTFLKYGRYEISDDEQRIYINKGVVDESVFAISKNRVQAIEINQSFTKRMLGLAEIKLISAGSIGEETLEQSSLYPFLPVKKAYQMIGELLPSYEVTQTMDRLPKKSFWIRILKPSWFWVIATIALFYFKPEILKIEQTWWILSAALLLFIVFVRLLDYFNTAYRINGKFIQFKTGGLATSVFISKREKIVEVNITRTKFQQFLGLASIGTINHAKPFHHAGVKDIPVDQAASFYTWYANRVNEIEIK